MATMILNNCKIKGSGREIKLKYTTSGEPYFMFNGYRQKLSEYMRIMDNVLLENGFNAFKSESAFSGILIKYIDGSDGVMAYNYLSMT